MHLNYIHSYHTAHDPHLNRCWKKFCLIVFESPHLRNEELTQKTEEIIKEV